MVCLLTWSAGVARADDEPPTIGEETIRVSSDGPHGEMISTSGSMSMVSERNVSGGWLILPEGQEVGAELRFITAKPASLGADELAFSDIGILGLHARTALGGKVDLAAAVDLLPKQPSYADERIWQGATLGINAQPWRRAVALRARVGGGPMLGDLGWWGQGALGVDARKQLHAIMTFQGGISAVGTTLLPDAAASDPAWLVEAAVTGSVLFRDPEGWTGGWLGFGYALPVSHAGRDPMSGVSLDPQPRLDLALGVVLSFVDNWDIYARYAYIDRGDMAAMATRLPILDGGFDQGQIVLGVNYHPKSSTDSTLTSW